MRKEATINENWFFTKQKQKGALESTSGWEKINLPHTWNAHDGQDGGADYYRGECLYQKEIDFSHVCPEKLYYIEFSAVASKCEVYVNGKEVCRHKGGYSKFRANITEQIKTGKNMISVIVDNSPQSDIYPQMADFTFYGGIHRGVKIIEVNKTHFDLDFYGGCGVQAYSVISDGGSAELHVKSYIKGYEQGDSVRYSLLDAQCREVCEVYTPAQDCETVIDIENVHLWQGVRDPYLYKIKAQIVRHNEVLDNVSIPHGFRSFYVDAEKGFFLNGESMPLRGVSRHGDKLGVGLALTPDDHIRDAELIREVGANAVRLAHYQHDEYFYELCDEYGFVVWAEIPFISKMNEDKSAHENCLSQMKELIYQNYNHPCICFWGISNEITIGGYPQGLVENLRELNCLVHELDKTRLSTMAQVSMLPIEDEQNNITDIIAYNHYFGWYAGKLSDNEEWLDTFHKKYPKTALGLSEYGCEGIVTYHTKNPRGGDYTEEYQALYHEHMLPVLKERDWIWGSFVWNMFDFGCDARDEGGVSGRNNKGLVSFDRAIKKDSFYICRAFWSDEPFLHICSKRYALRSGDSTAVKVYSNCDKVTLFVNGDEVESMSGKYVFEFYDVPLRCGNNTVTVRCGDLTDTTVIRRVDREPDSYILTEEETGVANWFDIVSDDPPELEFKKGYYSVKMTVREILDSPEAGDIFVSMLASVSGMKVKKTMLMMMMADQTLEGLILGSIGAAKSSEEIQKTMRQLNAALQKISVVEVKADK